MPESFHVSFHDAFERALAGESSALDTWRTSGVGIETGLRVYRNTSAKGLADAIKAQFPTVTAIVGDDWMAAAARAFCAVHPPGLPPLTTYGEAFPTWLEGPSRDQDLPYLTDLARLDRLWTECHTAADDPVLAPDALAKLDPQDFLGYRLVPRASTRLAFFPWAIPTLWRTLRQDPGLETFDLEDRSEGLLLTRPDLEVESAVLSIGADAFLNACKQGLSIVASAEAALSVEPDLNLQSTFAVLLGAGVFTALEDIAP